MRELGWNITNYNPFSLQFCNSVMSEQVYLGYAFPAILNVFLKLMDASEVSNSGSFLANELLYSSESTKQSLKTWLSIGDQLGYASLSANSLFLLNHNI